MIAAALIAFLIVLALTPLVRILCLRAQILDRPGPLKIHLTPTPRLGGIAIFVGIMGGVFAANSHAATADWSVLAAFALIWLTGILDDLRSLPATLRLAVQFACAALLWHAGLRLVIFDNAPANFTIEAGFAMLLINSMNWLDGIDGLAAGIASLITLAYALTPSHSLTPLGLATACSACGACAAFLFFNLEPASIFGGDSSSTLLGLIIAFLGLDLARQHQPSTSHDILVPLLISSVPVLDALFVVLGRLARRESPLAGNRCHAYDLLRDQGWSVSSVISVSCAVTAICVAIAAAIERHVISSAWAALGFGLSVLWIIAPRLGSFAEARMPLPRRLFARGTFR